MLDGSGEPSYEPVNNLSLGCRSNRSLPTPTNIEIQINQISRRPSTSNRQFADITPTRFPEAPLCQNQADFPRVLARGVSNGSAIDNRPSMSAITTELNIYL
jgi:hypothetical protein